MTRFDSCTLRCSGRLPEWPVCFYHMSSNRITQAPLPRLTDLLRMLLDATPGEEGLSELWVRPGDRAHWFSRSAWSLAAVVRWRQRAMGKNSVTVWVPDFFCNESLGLLRKLGAKLVFYPINARGHPDAREFPAVAEQNQPDLFLLVHYFGEPSPGEEAVAFCRSHRAWLVEDAAHVLAPGPGIGEAGDCVLYSPHKHLPVPDGAILVVRSEGPSALATQSDLLSGLAAVVADTLGSGRSLDGATAVWVAKRLLQKLGFRSRRRLPSFSSHVQAAPAMVGPSRMSAAAKRLLKYELARMPELAAHRASCAGAWAEMIRGVYPASRCAVVPVRHTPYLACVAAPDQAAAEFLYARLHSVGVPVSTWPDLPPEVMASAADHRVAQTFRHTRIYLPVHRNVDTRQIGLCGRKMRRAITKNWRARRIESHAEWEKLWIGCKRKTLPQTWEYGSAKVAAEFWQAQRYVIHDDYNVPMALFQVLVKGLPGFGGVARVNRGPLMLCDQPEGDHSLALCVIAVLVREARRRRWWMMQMAPLLPPDPGLENALGSMGFRKRPDCPMDSALLSLERSEDHLMMGLNGKWRNCLRKAQKLGVTVRLDEGGRAEFQRLLDFYKSQQLGKRFDGTSDRMLRALAGNQSRFFRFNLFVAMAGPDSPSGTLLGVLVTLQFGDVSEYLIGATNDMGRANQANSVLLWEAILDAKRNGCLWLDVGGLAKNTPKGIADFKIGLNAKPYALVGEWRRWF